MHQEGHAGELRAGAGRRIDRSSATGHEVAAAIDAQELLISASCVSFIHKTGTGQFVGARSRPSGHRGNGATPSPQSPRPTSAGPSRLRRTRHPLPREKAWVAVGYRLYQIFRRRARQIHDLNPRVFLGEQRPVTACTFSQPLGPQRLSLSTGDGLADLVVVACGFIGQPS